MYSQYGEEFGLGGGSRWQRLSLRTKILTIVGGALVLFLFGWLVLGAVASDSAASQPTVAPTPSEIPLPWRYNIVNVQRRELSDGQALILTIRIGNFSEARGSSDRARIYLRDGQGRLYQPDLARSQPQPGSLRPLFETLAPGQTTQVSLTFVLPKEAGDLELVVRPLDGSTPTEIKLSEQAQPTPATVSPAATPAA
ncbi:MAG: DUF4352 domain-containing protein [Chloroflexi bacterium]|nr:DUF4352 domain-containing protein [Chloroflexota bacterium]